jgi:hypothetical protein
VTALELPVATEISGVNMRLTPGGIRELHWHPNADEWQYYIGGKGRMTVFAASDDQDAILWSPGAFEHRPYNGWTRPFAIVSPLHGCLVLLCMPFFNATLSAHATG